MDTPSPGLSHLGQERKERNRQAQHAFRQRRHASEDAQRRRIQHLENTVEEMSNVLIGFCDEMIGTEEIARQPRLMARLQRCTAQALVLARSVSNTAAHRETEGDGRKMDQYPTKNPDRRVGDSRSPQASSRHRAEATTPLIEQVWLQTHHYELDTDSSFPLRLVETTISRACLYLNGDVYIAADDMERAFGSSLRLHTRQQLLAHMRWLLGPGKDEMHQATGINWSTAWTRGAGGSSTDLFWPSAEDSSPGTDDDSEDLQPELLTALGVQEQLQSLGAKVLGSDLMELSIGGHELLQVGTADSGPAIGAIRPARTRSPEGTSLFLSTEKVLCSILC
ncbi:hypothetical protein ACJ41O_000264 [Fusarium nematophilum]